MSQTSKGNGILAPTNTDPAESAPASPRVNGQSRGATSTPVVFAGHQPNASLVLVGIRGCGKRSLGLIAATALGRRFITEDHFFQTATGYSRQDYLKVYGSEEFHKHDVEITRRMLDENKHGCVIDCGLGSLTSALQEHLRSYMLTNPVIYILRDMKQIMQLLKLSEHSAKRLELVDPTHRRCSSYEYFNIEDVSAEPGPMDNEHQDRASPAYSFKLREAQADFSHFVRLITGTTAMTSSLQSPFALDAPFYTRLFTHALLVPFSAYCDGKVELPVLESGGDVMEILVDRWQHGSARLLSRMLADIRRQLKTPILLSIAWEGLRPNTESYTEILRQGLRLAVEYLAVDLELGTQRISELFLNRGSTRLIATAMLEKSSAGSSVWLDGTASAAVKQATSFRFDLLRLTHSSTSRDENENVTQFLHSLRLQDSASIEVTAYNIGLLGRTSQIFNRGLTSVTHESLRTLEPRSELSVLPALTSQESIKSLFSSFMLDPLDFCIIGGNVSSSLSPAMHNAAYRLLGLQHKYTTNNIRSWEDVELLAKNPNFGGASIVQPWKVRLATKVAHLSEHARIIGAINTIVPLRSRADGSVMSLYVQAAQRNRAGDVRAWYGANTDWIAISTCISRSLSPRNVIQPKSTALVVGAGGMARSATYALLQLGCKNIFIYNRTIKNGEILAEHFNRWLTNRNGSDASNTASVAVLTDYNESWPSGVNLPTIIVSCVTHEHLEGRPDSNFTMPSAWLGSESGGVVLELAYMTRETPLTIQIKEYRQETNIPWVVVDGIEMLFEQALAQFEIMTGRPAPQRCMREAINRAIQERQTFVADGEEFEVV